MRKKVGVIWLVGLLLTVAACHTEESPAKYRLHADLDKAMKMNFSDFMDSIFVVPLETNDSSLVKKAASLSVARGCFYLNDNREKILSFDAQGNFLYSTARLHGNGPNEYVTCMAFNVSEEGRLEIFDALRHRLWEYGPDLKYVSSYELAEEVLPASHFLRVSEDMCIAEDTHSLKFYSLKDKKVLKVLSLPCREGLPSISPNAGLKVVDGEIYYSHRTPDNLLYKVSMKDMSLQPYCAFHFGTYDFDWDELPGGQPLSFYQDYVMTHDAKAFVADKWVSPHARMCFLVHDKQMYFVFHDAGSGPPRVYYNEPHSPGQLMIPHLYRDGVLYSVCEPQYLAHVLDFDLMSPGDIEKVKAVKADDNPVIVCYKLKRKR